MSSLTAVAGQHLSSLGVPPDFLSNLTRNLQAHDIFAMGLRFALIGILAASVRSFYSRIKLSLYDALFPTAYIGHNDPAYEWVFAFLAQHPDAQAQLSSFQLITADARESKRDDGRRNTSDTRTKNSLLLSKGEATFDNGQVIGQMAPWFDRDIKIQHNGKTLWLRRSADGWPARSSSAETYHWKISSIFFQKEAITELLVAAHELYFKKSDQEILIFHPSPYNGAWYDPISRPARTWSSVILAPEIKNTLLEDVRAFLTEDDKAWYAARGIPHRRGYLLHGRPGSGKTTLATAVASALKVDIYTVNPAARGMDDGKLNKVFRSCPPGNMILIEDIDCVMPKARKTDSGDSDDEDDGADAQDGNADPGRFGLARSTVTLSGLLNAIDGVSSQEDCILLATTNHPNKLDHALSRPGRFDVHLAFHDATPTQAFQLFKHFYPLAELDQCICSSSVTEKAPVSADDEQNELAQRFSDGLFGANGKVGEGDAGGNEEEEELSVSMAALQGYLLNHKKDGRGAVEGVSEWANGLREEQKERAKKKRERKAERERIKAAALAAAAAKEGEGESPPTPVSANGQ